MARHRYELSIKKRETDPRGMIFENMNWIEALPYRI
jgi:hypothetical protein